MARIRGRHLINLPRVPEALAYAAGMRSPVGKGDEPADPPHAIQAALATSLAECLAAIRSVRPRPLIGGGVSKRRVDFRAYADAKRNLDLLLANASEDEEISDED